MGDDRDHNEGPTDFDEPIEVNAEPDPLALPTPTELEHAQWDEALDAGPRPGSVPFGLTYRQWLFLCEYFVDLNASQAAVRAGYKSTAAAGQLMRHPVIRHALDWFLESRAKLYSTEHSRIIQELAAIAYADPGDYSRWNGSSVDLVDSSQIQAHKRRAIRKIKHVETISKSGMRATTEIEFCDKLKALEMLGRATGLFREHETNDNRGAFRAWFDGVMSGQVAPATREIDVTEYDASEDRGEHNDEED